MELGHPPETWKRRRDHPGRAGLHAAARLALADGDAVRRPDRGRRPRARRSHGARAAPHVVDRAVIARTMPGRSVEGAAAAGHGLRAARAGSDHDRRHRERAGLGIGGCVAGVRDRRGQPRSGRQGEREADVGRAEPLRVRARSPTPTSSASTRSTTIRCGRRTRSRCSSTPTATAAATSSCRSTRTTRRSTRGSRRRARSPAIELGLGHGDRGEGARHRRQAGDTDQGWDAEIAIPWPAVKGRDETMAVSAAAAGRRSLADERRARRSRSDGASGRARRSRGTGSRPPTSTRSIAC